MGVLRGMLGSLLLRGNLGWALRLLLNDLSLWRWSLETAITMTALQWQHGARGRHWKTNRAHRTCDCSCYQLSASERWKEALSSLNIKFEQSQCKM